MSHHFRPDPRQTEPTLADDVIPDAYRHVPTPQGVRDVDARFVFDFRPYDDLQDGQRWSTWLSVEALCRGPSRVRTGW